MAVSTEEIRSMTAPNGRGNADDEYRIALAKFEAQFPPKTPEEIASMTAAEKYAYVVERCKKMPKRKPKTIEELHYQIRSDMIDQRMDQENAAFAAECDLQIQLWKAEAALAAQRREFQEEQKQQSEDLAIVRSDVAVVKEKVEAMWDGMYLPEQKRKERIHAIEQEPTKYAYFDTARTTLKARLSALEVVSTEMVKRGNYTALDFLATVTKHIGGYLPIGTGITNTIAGIMQAVSNAKEVRNSQQVMKNVDYNLGAFAEEVAMELVDHCFHNGITNEKTAVSEATSHINAVMKALQSPPNKDFASFKVKTQETPLASQVIQHLILLKKLPSAVSVVNGKAFTPLAASQKQQDQKSAFSRFLTRAAATPAPAPALAVR